MHFIKSTAATIVAFVFLSTAHAELQYRDVSGDGVLDAFYDTELNITWLANANINGQMSWSDANQWASNLVMGSYDDWRLPTVSPVNGTNFQYDLSWNGRTDYGNALTGLGWGTANEMGHLFYVTFGNTGHCAPIDPPGSSCVEQVGFGFANTGLFSNIQNNYYWTGTEASNDSSKAWMFYTGYGTTYTAEKPLTTSFYAMGVRDGDSGVEVSAPAAPVPEAETFAMMLAGLGLVCTVARRRQVKFASNVTPLST